MYHKPEVYIALRHPFALAWREFSSSCKASVLPMENVFARHKVDIADEVARFAHIPSMSSQKVIIQMAIKPWQKPNLTKDDGILEMSVQQIKRICLDWLNANANKLIASS